MVALKVTVSISHFIAPVSITILEKSLVSTSSFTINCTSEGSPPSAVSWTKDGVQLRSSAVYSMEQLMQHGPTATYVNLLSVNMGPYGVLGTYTCNVSNILGSTATNISFGGMLHAEAKMCPPMIVTYCLKLLPSYLIINSLLRAFTACNNW